MTLDPDRFECPTHGTVLTGLVEEALEDDDPPLAYFRPRNPSAARPFQVIVTCPGANGSGAHQLTCEGTRTP